MQKLLGRSYNILHCTIHCIYSELDLRQWWLGKANAKMKKTWKNIPSNGDFTVVYHRKHKRSQEKIGLRNVEALLQFLQFVGWFPLFFLGNDHPKYPQPIRFVCPIIWARTWKFRAFSWGISLILSPFGGGIPKLFGEPLSRRKCATRIIQFVHPTSAVEILKNRQSKRSMPSVKPACLGRKLTWLTKLMWSSQKWHLKKATVFLRDTKRKHQRSRWNWYSNMA